MKDRFLLRHGIRIAGLSALASVLLFTVVTFLSYQSDKRLIDLWEGYLASEEQLFRLREDANRLYEIEHRLTVGGVHLDDELRKAGVELGKIPSLEGVTRRKLTLLKEARSLLIQNRDSRASAILRGNELDQINKDLRETLFEFEINERNRLQEKLASRLDSQQEILEFDVAGILFAIVLLISASVLVLFYIQRLRKYDRALLEARNQAERASRMKSAFLANMSHEIRTPLNGVLGLTRLLSETGLNNDQSDLVDSLEASGRTLLSIVNDILDLSKIESGKIEIETVVFDVRALLFDVDKAFRPNSERRGLRLTIEGPGDTVLVMGDPAKIRQIVQNLLSNAMKFTREGEVRLRWRIEGGIRGPFMRFEVKDTGIGISEESQSRVFHPFEQADSSTSRHYGGSGLGLAICRHLVEAMGGEIGLESRSGLGSLFWFTIPFEAAPEGSAPAPARTEVADTKPTVLSRSPAVAKSPAVKSASKLLLVEDNEVNRHLVVTFLKRRGFVIETAENGLIALEMLRDNKYDLVLMDGHLPEMDGYEATTRIRNGEAGAAAQKLPIIALTASAIKGQRERCLEIGMDDYLTKPIDLDLLEKTILKFLGKESLKAEQEPSMQRPPPKRGPMPASLKNAQNSDRPRVPDLDDELKAELAAIFRRVTPGRVRDLKTAIEKEDFNAAGKIAHTIKSSAAQLGLLELADICKRMEAKGLEGHGEQSWMDMYGEFESKMNDSLSTLPESAPNA